MVANAVPLRTMATRDNTDIEVSRQPRDGIDRHHGDLSAPLLV